MEPAGGEGQPARQLAGDLGNGATTCEHHGLSRCDREASGKWTVGARVISDQIDRAKLRFTLTRGLTDSLQVGIEWNPLAEKVSPLANWRAISETSDVLRSSSGRHPIASGRPRANPSTSRRARICLPGCGCRWRRTVGVAYGTYEDKARAIAGLNIYFPASVSSLVIYDGVKVHPTLSWSRDRHTISFVLANAEDPGVSYSVVF